MADKPKIPKGTPDCVAILPEQMRQEFADEHIGPRGSQRGYTWADEQIALAQERKRRFDLQLLANARMDPIITGHSRGVMRGAASLLAKDTFQQGGTPSVQSRAEAIEGKLHTIMAEFLETFRPILGFARDPEGVRNVALEIFGKATGDQDAAKFAQAWNTVTEYVRKRMNDAGAQIPKLPDWGLPQFNDPGKVAAVNVDKWLEDTIPLLDIDRMAENTGLTRQEVVTHLRDQVYHNIATDGAWKIDATQVNGRRQARAVYNMHSQHRFMHFKDGDAWLTYQGLYGTNDILSTMTGWMNRVAKDIALMEVMGPNPDVGFQHIVDVVSKAEGKDRSRSISYLEKLYGTIRGSAGTANPKFADWAQRVRDGNVIGHLGKAFLSMATDPAFLVMTARLNDVPAIRSFMRQLRMLAGDPEGRQFATQIGLVAEYAQDRMISQYRHTMSMGQGWMGRLSDLTMRASLLHGATVAGRQAFGMEYMAALARDSKKSWDQLSRQRRDGFRRMGITEKDWNVIRRSRKSVLRGTSFVDINALRNRDVATKVSALIHEEMDYAVPTPDGNVRALMQQNTAKGTPEGELLRALGEFKSFPVTMTLLHGRRAMHTKAMSKAEYAAAMTVGLWTLGFVALQAKEIAKGRDPEPLVLPDGSPNLNLWIRALAQGGGLGIYGDFFLQDQTRYGASIGEQIAGPTFGLATDVFALGQQAIKAGAEAAGVIDPDENTAKLGKQVAKAIETYQPEVWWTSLAQNRLINAAIKDQISPNWRSDAEAKARNIRREKGQDMWWDETAMAPERGPQLIKR